MVPHRFGNLKSFRFVSPQKYFISLTTTPCNFSYKITLSHNFSQWCCKYSLFRDR